MADYDADEAFFEQLQAANQTKAKREADRVLNLRIRRCAEDLMIQRTTYALGSAITAIEDARIIIKNIDIAMRSDDPYKD